MLAQHPAVAEAAGGIDERRAGERALVAWWAARPGEDATAAEFRGFLKERLPEPMVPSLFALLPPLPRNASGKLDRRALPAPKLEAASAGGYETPAEEAVAYVWRDVLGVPLREAGEPRCSIVSFPPDSPHFLSWPCHGPSKVNKSPSILA